MSTFLPTVRRVTVSVSIALAAVLSLGGLLLQPAFPDQPAEFIALLAGSPTAALGVQLFVWSQLFWAIGLVGAGHLVARRARVLGLLGAIFGALGAFGHAVYGGTQVLLVAVADDTDTALAVMEVTQSAPFIPFLITGLAATVLGYIFIAIGLIRGHSAPLWVPIALLVWVVVEFVLPNFVDWSNYLSLVLGIIAFAGVAVTVWRSDRAVWATAAEAAAAGATAEATVLAPAAVVSDR